ncbi:MAG: ABC transporter permease [Chloroflexi bacterium]|nr:ABC transporter permease [Chloroflexota bacterium]
MSTTERANISAPVGTAAPIATSSRIVTPWQRFYYRFRHHKMAMVSVGFIILLSLMGIFAPIVAPLDPTKTNLSQALQGPDAAHWLGTDPSGRDVWSRIIYAIRVSLSVGIVAVGISVAISLVLGTLSGFYGGQVDMVIMRITDVIMSFPGLIIIMTVVALLGPSIYNVMAVIGLLGWPGTTRLIRAQILSVREWDFITAARCVGVPDRRIMFVHVLPNAVAPLVVAATFGVAGAILTEAGLSFLGLGVLPPAPSWGNMLNQARSISMLERNVWFWMPPGIMILLTVLAINFIGDGLRDALDPRMKLN